MKDFLRPTKVTWVVFLVFLVIFVAPMVLSFVDDFLKIGVGLDTVRGLFAPMLFSVYVIFVLLFRLLHSILGSSVGSWNSGRFSYPEPNLFGWVLVLLMETVIWYLFASVISKIWYALKSRNKQI